MTIDVPTRPRVFLDVQSGVEFLGRIIIELFSDKTPKTSENFRAICTSSHTPPSSAEPLTYKHSPFHRIIDEFMIQGGDITAGNGTGGASIYGGDLVDENIGWRQIDTAGLVCMANRGANTNSSQFFITLAPCEHLNAKHTVFGHVVRGMDVCERMAKLPVDSKDRPLSEVIVSHCGELERRPKPSTGPQTPIAKQKRARHRSQEKVEVKSPHYRSLSGSTSSRSSSRSPPRRGKGREQRSTSLRRRSDMGLDENRRGRNSTRSISPQGLSSKSPPQHRRHRRRSSPPSRSRSSRRSRSPHLRRRPTDRKKSPRYSDKPDQRDRYHKNYHRKQRQEREDYEIRHESDYRGRLYRDKYGGIQRLERRVKPDQQAYDVRQGRDHGPMDGDIPQQNSGLGQRDNGRLGDDKEDSGIKFKGRGSMKYRERKW